MSALISYEPVPPDDSTLARLAVTVNREHVLVAEAVASAVEHAILAGEALLQAREQLAPNTWTSWVRENLSCSPELARMYVRVAFNSELVRSEGATSVKQALRLVSEQGAVVPHPSSARRLERQREARRLLAAGFTQAEVGEMFGGVSQNAIHLLVNDKAFSRSKQRTARIMARQRAARQALKEQEQQRIIKRAVRKAGAATQEAYAMAERFQDVLAQASDEITDSEAQAALARAGEHYRRMRDEIVRALGVS